MKTKLLLAIIGILICFTGQSLFAADRNAGDVWVEPLTGMEFVYVPGGCFIMGDVFGDGAPFMKPAHEVCVNDFYMAKYEVTQAEWFGVMGLTVGQQRDKIGATLPLYGVGEDLPIYYVSWNDAHAFTRSLTAKSGKHFLLPTEAEWEFAARSGGEKERFAGGMDIDSVAWYSGNSDKKVHPVNSKKPNGLGLYNMSGNVLEWTQDLYENDYYSKSPRFNPQGAAYGRDRSHRGGSWLRRANDAETSYRGCRSPQDIHQESGLRVLLPAGQLL